MLQKAYVVSPNSDCGENSFSTFRQGYWFNCVKCTGQTQENSLSLEAPAESDGMVSLTRADFPVLCKWKKISSQIFHQREGEISCSWSLEVTSGSTVAWDKKNLNIVAVQSLLTLSGM